MNGLGLNVSPDEIDFAARHGLTPEEYVRHKDEIGKRCNFRNGSCRIGDSPHNCINFKTALLEVLGHSRYFANAEQ